MRDDPPPWPSRAGQGPERVCGEMGRLGLKGWHPQCKRVRETAVGSPTERGGNRGCLVSAQGDLSLPGTDPTRKGRCTRAAGAEEQGGPTVLQLLVLRERPVRGHVRSYEHCPRVLQHLQEPSVTAPCLCPPCPAVLPAALEPPGGAPPCPPFCSPLGYLTPAVTSFPARPPQRHHCPNASPAPRSL